MEYLTSTYNQGATSTSTFCGYGEIEEFFRWNYPTPDNSIMARKLNYILKHKAKNHFPIIKCLS